MGWGGILSLKAVRAKVGNLSSKEGEIQGSAFFEATCFP